MAERIGFIGPRFHTLIGAIFLVIVLVSPGGLIELWERVLNLFSGSRRGPLDRAPVELGHAGEPAHRGGVDGVDRCRRQHDQPGDAARTLRHSRRTE